MVESYRDGVPYCQGLVDSLRDHFAACSATAWRGRHASRVKRFTVVGKVFVLSSHVKRERSLVSRSSCAQYMPADVRLGPYT